MTKHTWSQSNNNKIHWHWSMSLPFPVSIGIAAVEDREQTEANNELLTNTRDVQASLVYSDRCIRGDDCPSTSVIRKAQQWRHRLACLFLDVVLLWLSRSSSSTATICKHIACVHANPYWPIIRYFVTASQTTKVDGRPLQQRHLVRVHNDAWASRE